MSKEFEELLKREGIQRQLTIPGTSQQNGVSERRNLTLANVTRCLLIESGLPLSFWGEAITTATTRKIILARDVVFDENIFPAQNWNRYTYEKPKEWAKIYIEAQEELIDEPITADIPNEVIHENSENSCENLVHDIVDIVEESDGENFETEETEHTEMNNQFFSSRNGRRIIEQSILLITKRTANNSSSVE
ncbi:hypothetical protein QE152_g3526 [Popillia japonica]|uniref:Integrase catalytic domain-containing protein n=1 Tax=Popillia japonica TaxID=7064 RepID=A0AAW1N413_POPJA